MKRFFTVSLVALLLCTAAIAAWCTNKNNPRAIAHKSIPLPAADPALKEKLSSMAASAKNYAAGKKFNTQFCFLADISIASGKQRFFVYDMNNDSILAAGLVAHGRCNQKWLNGRKYGNSIGCGCTSLGKYKIGNAYRGQFGLAYKLSGLDTTNSNAYNRFVVLHSHECVPEKQVDPNAICQSDGCPTVSPEFLQKLAVYLNNSRQPVLLWMFE